MKSCQDTLHESRSMCQANNTIHMVNMMGCIPEEANERVLCLWSNARDWWSTHMKGSGHLADTTCSIWCQQEKEWQDETLCGWSCCHNYVPPEYTFYLLTPSEIALHNPTLWHQETGSSEFCPWSHQESSQGVVTAISTPHIMHYIIGIPDKVVIV